MSYPWLPHELVSRVLTHLTPSYHSQESVLALVRFSETHSIFRKLAIDPLLWEQHYRATYGSWRKEEEMLRRLQTNNDWYQLFVARQKLDGQGLRLLDEIVQNAGGARDRQAKALLLVRELSFDVWDVLVRERERHLPLGRWDDQNQESIPPQYQNLTRTFWSKAMLGAITRHQAVKTWATLAEGSNLPAASVEEAYNALSTFWGSSIREIQTLTMLICKEYAETRLFLDMQRLSGEGTVADLRMLSLSICEYMHEAGFGASDGPNFHNLFNHFPHFFLEPRLRKNSLPIALVYTFVVIARRIGLEAHTLNYPSTVIARLDWPDTGSTIFVNVFRSLKPVDGRIELCLENLATTSEYTKPASTKDMLLRATSNIAASLQLLDHTGLETFSPMDITSAVYALRAARCVVGEPDISPARLVTLSERYHPLDLLGVVQEAIGPVLSDVHKASLDEKIEETLQSQEDQDKERRVRSTCGAELEFFVGQAFSHKRFNYRALIIGWDAECLAGTEWIKQMRVNELSRGAKQPFYNVLNTSGTQHYVAEENIAPTELTEELFQDLSISFPNIGQYFQEVEFAPGKGRLVLSPERQRMYPEDNEAGTQWAEDTFPIGDAGLD